MARVAAVAPRGDTRDRVLDEALLAFGLHGFDATSLDQIAAELGVRKQTILYYFPSKNELLEALVDRTSATIADELERAIKGAEPGFARIELIVRTVFRVAVRQPELLGLLREVSRLGGPFATRFVDNFEPLVERATSFLQEEMDAGRFRASDPRLLLVSVYSTVVGVATEVEVLRAVGFEPSLKSAVQRRRELLTFLHNALVP